MTNQIYKNSPFGYKSSIELFNNIITKKYEKLKDADTLEEYYDFIFAAGALRDWIKTEFKLSYKDMKRLFYNDKFFCIFHSIYNNCKHYILDSVHYSFVILDGVPLFDTDENGITHWDDNAIWDDSCYWIESIKGRKGNFKYFCSINDGEDFYLYEICIQVYEKYKNILNELSNATLIEVRP